MITTSGWKLQGFGLLALVFLCFFPPAHRLHEYLFFALLLTGIGTVLAEGRPLWVRTPIDVPLLALVIWILVSVPFATDPFYSFSEWRKLAAGVLAFYWTIMVIRSDPTESLRQRSFVVILLASTVLSGGAIVEFAAQGGSWRDRTIRAAALSSDYNWLSTYLVLSFPFVAAAAMTARSWTWRLGAIGLCGLQGMTQLLSYTRAGWLAMVLEIVLFGSFFRRHAVLVAVGTTVGMVAVVLVVLAAMGFQAETASANTFYYRLASWRLMLGEIAAHPVFGIGYGNGTFMLKFGALPEAHDAAGAHSLFLMVAMGSGLPALACLIWTAGAALKAILSAIETTEGKNHAFLMAVWIAVIGFLVRNLFDHMLIGMLGYLFWILLASGLAGIEASGAKRAAMVHHSA